MARRKKGLPIDGWLVVDKPQGMTSAQVVSKARWALRAQKAGHAGTLDPLATGVLAVAFGEATKTVPYVTDALKAYAFTVRWGASTTTDDAEGEVIARSDLRPDRAAIEAALPDFEGEIMQTPPAFSAVKVDGERAYDLARAGEQVALAPRPLWVESLTLTDIPDPDHAVFEMVCGKGGYVRAIARDLGRVLGCGGHVTQLRRIWAGPFELADAVSIEALEAMRDDPDAAARLLPVEAGLSGLEEIPVTAEGAGRLRAGQPAPALRADAEYGDAVWASHDGRAVAIGVYKGGQVHPNRVFAAD
ncbi:tRNA pseudouridine(55) synthase TruB [Oceanicella actignis]|uniref:tRNA pseudouridine synthase B n=1 Tax=Oceanicella actignis TaxID=1189325 RepID=A0A1M7STF7_9RHOB|nr:tRNA pseudouridine(55) synthase TruB [Oceanicella actignis]TYO90708.1 tRNA pseudouridine synthase B [Oceanicella actignis]SES69936.1 tRNA pseudouridine synthase B [Oceanicella actignis]SHN61759.1 tRNA pseudouridine55 synthase [Oceanicella actignis]